MNTESFHCVLCDKNFLGLMAMKLERGDDHKQTGENDIEKFQTKKSQPVHSVNCFLTGRGRYKK